MTEKVITRFPPSPTGTLHIGNIRTLLFNYLYTRKHAGEIVMRFEDTDTERSSREHEGTALEALAALGLDFDHGPYRQSERTEKYVAALTTLIENDLAYVAEESEGEAGARVIRFRNPNKEITFTDLIRGEITIDTTDFGDFVIARSETSPLYHLTVVVDDLEMDITHVIRGEDHITSTPRQILLIEALGGTMPIYAHLPFIIGDDKKKLGKRHGAVSYQEFSAMGILPEALINYLALLGWNPGDDREIFSKEELIAEFSLERVNNSPAKFSYEKLFSINKHYLNQLSPEEYLQAVTKFAQETDLTELLEHPRYEDIVTLVLRERVSTLSDIATMFESGDFTWLTAAPEYKASELLWKESPATDAHKHLTHAIEALTAVSEWSVDALRDVVWPYAEEHGKGDVLWPMRFALSGQKKSPDPFTLAFILGKEECLARLNTAVELLP